MVWELYIFISKDSVDDLYFEYMMWGICFNLI